MTRVSVIIPTYQAVSYLPGLTKALNDQTIKPLEIIVIDSSSSDGTAAMARGAGCRVVVIPQSSFNHGATRNLAARHASGDVLVFMTQDALPHNSAFLSELIAPIREGRAWAAFARQIPYPTAAPPEVFARHFNYPPTSRLNTLSDEQRAGIKAFFFSNVASAVGRNEFWRVGGFPEDVILNEDMVLAAKLLRAGGATAYQASAQVYHSHSYSVCQQFKRYFDIGAAVEHTSVLLGGARAEGEGLRFTWGQLQYLVKTGAWWYVPRTVVEVGFKYLAYRLGRCERVLPVKVKRLLSMHAFFWA